MESSQSTHGMLWKDEYGVGIKEIDEQHKQLVDLINVLMGVIRTIPKEEVLKGLIDNIIQYKIAHFATEEKYFHLFEYEGTVEHEAAHRVFDKEIKALQEKHSGDTIALAFALVDFLENWFIGHLNGADKKYVQCFHDHGLS
jgi:hemerythrin